MFGNTMNISHATVNYTWLSIVGCDTKAQQKYILKVTVMHA